MLLGVVSVVFFIFNLGGDPVENLVAENASEEVKQAIRKKFDMDLPTSQRYVLYLNEISPLSIHNPTVEASRIYLDSSKYNYTKLIGFGENRTLVLKQPYFKRSYVSEKNVSEIIAEALPGTIVLAVTAIIIAIILGLLIGVFSALNKDSFMDHLAMFLSVLGMSGPSFFMAIIIAWLGGLVWYETTTIPGLPVSFFLLFLIAGLLLNYRRKQQKQEKLSMAKLGVGGLFTGIGVWVIGLLVNAWADSDIIPLVSSGIQLPGTGLSMNGSLVDVDVWEGEYINLKNLILPAITLGIRPLAVVVQLTRSSMLDVLSQDYIRTARAKGLSENKVIFKHALKNALNPVITAISGWFASLLAGAVFVEFVFGWKGLGMATYNALEKDDLPVVMGAVIVIASTFVFINLLVDLLYGVIDPRVRVS